MVDDDKGAKPATPLTVEHSAASGSVKPDTDASPQTEWTASDRRGPLDAAGDEDVERFVPAHETDAEGGADPTLHDPTLHEPELHEPSLNDPTLHEPVAHDASGQGEPSHDTPHGALEHDRHEDEAPVGGLSDSPAATSSEAARIAPPTSVAEIEPRRSLVPVAAGLVVGALIGAGSAWLVYSQAGGAAGEPQQLAALSSRVDALDKRPDAQAEVAKLQSGLSDVQGRVAALEHRVPATATAEPPKPDAPSVPDAKTAAASESTTTAPSDAGLAGKVAALQAALDEVKARTSALQAQDAKQDGAADKVATLQIGVADARKQAAGAQSALDAVRGEQKQLGDKIAGLTVAVAGALKKAEGAVTDAQAAQSQQKALEGKLGSPALAVVADSLVQQIDAGQPFARQVDALAALNADPARIAVLRENASHGVPSAQALLAQWKPLADPVIATGSKAPANANFGQRLEHGLFGLVSVRRADGTTGNDLASRVDLIAADLAHDDVPGAYAAWQALPADAKARSDSWGAMAKTSVEASAAARDLQHSAIDALGAKKS